MTRAVERSFGVGTVGISMTVVCSRCTFINIVAIFSISCITLLAATIIGSFSVCAVGIRITDVSQVLILRGQARWIAFVDVDTRDPFSRVSSVTRAVERSIGVGAVGISVTVVSKVNIFI